MGRTPVDLPDPVTWILSGVLSLHGASMEQALVDGSLTGEFAAWGVQYTAGLLLVPVAVCVFVGLVGVAQNLARKKREQPHEQPFIQDVAAANVEPLQAVYDEAVEVSDEVVDAEPVTAPIENEPAVKTATVNAESNDNNDPYGIDLSLLPDRVLDKDGAINRGNVYVYMWSRCEDEELKRTVTYQELKKVIEMDPSRLEELNQVLRQKASRNKSSHMHPDLEAQARRSRIGSKWAADEAYSKWFRSTLKVEDRKKYDAQVAREKEVIKAKEKLKQIQFKKDIDASVTHGLEVGEMGVFKW